MTWTARRRQTLIFRETLKTEACGNPQPLITILTSSENENQERKQEIEGVRQKGETEKGERERQETGERERPEREREGGVRQKGEREKGEREERRGRESH